MKKIKELSIPGESKFLQQIKAEFDPNLDALFYFNYREENEYETGYLILRRGEIRNKFYLEGPSKRPVRIHAR